MWVSVIANNADMEYWPVNSYVIHATSTKPQGPYEYVADAFPVFAHAVDVKRGPGGKWIAFNPPPPPFSPDPRCCPP